MASVSKGKTVFRVSKARAIRFIEFLHFISVFYSIYLYKLFTAFLIWKTEALREYLGKCGLAKDKAKQELAALCHSAHVMKIPEILSAVENLKVRQFDYQSLLNVNKRTTTPDPFTLHKNWADERNGMKS